MKIISLVIACLVLTQFSSGAVVITCQDLGNHIVELSFDASEESLPVACFSLVISVNRGVITNIELSDIISRGDEPGSYDSENVPVPGPGGLDSNSVILELGMAGDPPKTGVLLNFTVSENCSVLVAEERIYRGGIILQDGTHPEVLCYGCEVVPEPATIFLLGTGVIILRRKTA